MRVTELTINFGVEQYIIYNKSMYDWQQYCKVTYVYRLELSAIHNEHAIAAVAMSLTEDEPALHLMRNDDTEMSAHCAAPDQVSLQHILTTKESATLLLCYLNTQPVDNMHRMGLYRA